MGSFVTVRGQDVVSPVMLSRSDGARKRWFTGHQQGRKNTLKRIWNAPRSLWRPILLERNNEKRYPRRHSRIRAMMGDATHSSSAFAATAAVELDQSADIFRRRFPYAKCRMDLPMLWVLLRWDLQNGHLKNRYIWSALENYVYIRDYVYIISIWYMIYPWYIHDSYGYV